MYRFTNAVGDKLTAVLYAPGFGAGWSTWGHARMATDPTLIQYLLDESGKAMELSAQTAGDYLPVGQLINAEKFVNIVKAIYPSAYIGHSVIAQLTIGFVPQGALFRINDYDGSESIETFAVEGWTLA